MGSHSGTLSTPGIMGWGHNGFNCANDFGAAAGASSFFSSAGLAFDALFGCLHVAPLAG
jgi:hypothetical protein